MERLCPGRRTAHVGGHGGPGAGPGRVPARGHQAGPRGHGGRRGGRWRRPPARGRAGDGQHRFFRGHGRERLPVPDRQDPGRRHLPPRPPGPGFALLERQARRPADPESRSLRGRRRRDLPPAAGAPPRRRDPGAGARGRRRSGRRGRGPGLRRGQRAEHLRRLPRGDLGRRPGHRPSRPGHPDGDRSGPATQRLRLAERGHQRRAGPGLRRRPDHADAAGLLRGPRPDPDRGRPSRRRRFGPLPGVGSDLGRPERPDHPRAGRPLRSGAPGRLLRRGRPPRERRSCLRAAGPDRGTGRARRPGPAGRRRARREGGVQRRRRGGRRLRPRGDRPAAGRGRGTSARPEAQRVGGPGLRKRRRRTGPGRAGAAAPLPAAAGGGPGRPGQATLVGLARRPVPLRRGRRRLRPRRAPAHDPAGRYPRGPRRAAPGGRTRGAGADGRRRAGRGLDPLPGGRRGGGRRDVALERGQPLRPERRRRQGPLHRPRAGDLPVVRHRRLPRQRPAGALPTAGREDRDRGGAAAALRADGGSPRSGRTSGRRGGHPHRGPGGGPGPVLVRR